MRFKGSAVYLYESLCMYRLTDPELVALFAALDLSGDGSVDYDEFAKFVLEAESYVLCGRVVCTLRQR